MEHPDPAPELPPHLQAMVDANRADLELLRACNVVNGRGWLYDDDTDDH